MTGGRAPGLDEQGGSPDAAEDQPREIDNEVAGFARQAAGERGPQDREGEKIDLTGNTQHDDLARR